MNKKNNFIKYSLGLAVAIVLPLSFYIIAKVLKKDQIHMPRYFVADGVDSQLVDGKMRYDTVFHRTAELEGINQFGDHVGINKDLEGKIVVINFFFTTCPTICPQLTRNVKMLQNAFRPTPMKKNDKAVHFVSITVNPERDSSHVLFEYAKKYKADMNSWWFLTGDKKALYNYARNELHVVSPEGNGGADDFIHSQQIVLLDADRNIRGYYHGLDSLEVGKCAFDIGQLNMEKKHARR
jgi:protein SCO1/2